MRFVATFETTDICGAPKKDNMALVEHGGSCLPQLLEKRAQRLAYESSRVHIIVLRVDGITLLHNSIAIFRTPASFVYRFIWIAVKDLKLIY